MLAGTSPDAVTLDKAVQIARQFGPDIINTVQVLSPQQVMLEVRFIEVNRTAGREFGVQWNTYSNSGRFLANVGEPQAGRPASDHRRRLVHAAGRAASRCPRHLRRDERPAYPGRAERAADGADDFADRGRRRAVRYRAVRLHDRPADRQWHLRRRADQRARAEGRGALARRAEPGRAIRRHRELPRRRRVSRSRSRERSARSRSNGSASASSSPSPRPCSATG